MRWGGLHMDQLNCCLIKLSYPQNNKMNKIFISKLGAPSAHPCSVAMAGRRKLVQQLHVVSFLHAVGVYLRASPALGLPPMDAHPAQANPHPANPTNPPKSPIAFDRQKELAQKR